MSARVEKEAERLWLLLLLDRLDVVPGENQHCGHRGNDKSYLPARAFCKSRGDGFGPLASSMGDLRRTESALMKL